MSSVFATRHVRPFNWTLISRIKQLISWKRSRKSNWSRSTHLEQRFRPCQVSTRQPWCRVHRATLRRRQPPSKTTFVDWKMKWNRLWIPNRFKFKQLCNLKRWCITRRWLRTSLKMTRVSRRQRHSISHASCERSLTSRWRLERMLRKRTNRCSKTWTWSGPKANIREGITGQARWCRCDSVTVTIFSLPWLLALKPRMHSLLKIRLLAP